MNYPGFRFFVLPACGLAFSLAFMGCNHAGNEALPVAPVEMSQGPSPYEKEVIALKAGIADAEARESAIRTAMTRHGFQPADAAFPIPSLEHPSNASDPLAKSASAARVLVVKEFDFGFAMVIVRRINVGSNYTLTAYTTRSSSQLSVDPRLVAFYPEDADVQRTAIKVVGLNDDHTGLDSRFTWKNTTGSTRKVTVYTFAYSASSAGTATLNYRLNSPLGVQGPLTSVKGSLDATAVSQNLPLTHGCEAQDASSSTIDIKYLVGGGYNSALVAVNGSLMKGAYLFEGKPSFTMQHTIPSGGNNFLLGVFEGDGSGVYESTWLRGRQQDHFPFCF